ncbi:hypothetical protein H0H87_001564, partial [Tephrocybe sp. NHM501043]
MSSYKSTTCPTLEGLENFQIWKICITAKLHQEKVWDVIVNPIITQVAPTQTESPEAPMSTTPSHTSTAISQHVDSWAICDAKAAGIIVLCINNYLMLEVGNLTHVKEIFNKQVKIHISTNMG